MPFDTTPQLQLQRTKTTTVLLGWMFPIVATLIVSVLLLAWRHDLPDPIASHWGSSDMPDGFLSFTGHFVSTVFILILIPALTTGIAWRQLKSGSWGVIDRILVAVAVGSTVMNGFTLSMTVWVQRGLSDAALAPGIVQWTIAGAVLGLAAGAAAYFVQPRFTLSRFSKDEPSEPSSELDTGAGDFPEVWFGTASAPRVANLVILGLAALMWLGAVLAVSLTEEGFLISLILGVGATVVALSYGMFASRFEVSASVSGLRVRSAFGWPTIRIPLEDIVSVENRRVDPFGEFGGWGYRFSTDGRRGVVVRAGDAIHVTRRNGKVFVVTVDGAATGAAVLDHHLTHR